MDDWSEHQSSARQEKAAQRKCIDIEVVAAHLHGMLDELM